MDLIDLNDTAPVQGKRSTHDTSDKNDANFDVNTANGRNDQIRADDGGQDLKE